MNNEDTMNTPKEKPEPKTILTVLMILGMKSVLEEYSNSDHREQLTEEQEAQFVATLERMIPWIEQSLKDANEVLPDLIPMNESETEDMDGNTDDPFVIKIVGLLPDLLDGLGVPK